MKSSRSGAGATRYARHADAIWKALKDARPAGLHMPQLLQTTELTRMRTQSGMAMLHDIIMKKGWPP